MEEALQGSRIKRRRRRSRKSGMMTEEGGGKDEENRRRGDDDETERGVFISVPEIVFYEFVLTLKRVPHCRIPNWGCATNAAVDPKLLSQIDVWGSERPLPSWRPIN